MTVPSQPIDNIRCNDCGSRHVRVALQSSCKQIWELLPNGEMKLTEEQSDDSRVADVECLNCGSHNWERNFSE